MSEQENIQANAKLGRNRQAQKQNDAQPSPLPTPTNRDKKSWEIYWEARDQPWRAEPEIDIDQQKYLAERRSIQPNIEQGIYPFKDIKLNRADVEWLLATHQNGQGPVYWSDERQRERVVLDLRGADLRGVDLHGLSLAGLSAGFDVDRWSPRHIASIQLAVTNLEEVDLSEAHLEGANLRWVHLENSILRGAHLEGADLQYAHLEGGDLREAHLEGTNLRETFMERTNLRQAHLEGADLRYVHFEGANLRYTHLEGKYLSSEDAERIQKWAKNIPTHLPPADLREAFFDEATNLGNLILGNTTSGFVKLADVRWDNTNLSYISWSTVKMLGDESVARQKRQNGKETDSIMHLNEYEDALRANRQLAVVLRDQGLNEEADHFAYRAQLLQRVVWHLQSRPLKFVLSWFLYLLAGYGYRPGRTVAWYLVVIIGFALTYHALGGLTLFPPDAFVFSIMSFHGRGFFPSLSGETNLHNPLVMLAAVEAVIGLVIEISFIATFTQRFFGK